jgi:hypothetical protein
MQCLRSLAPASRAMQFMRGRLSNPSQPQAHMCSLLTGTYIPAGKGHNARTFRPDARLYRTSACVLKRRAWGSGSDDDDDRPKRYDREDDYARSDDEGGPPVERKRYVTTNVVVSRGLGLVSILTCTSHYINQSRPPLSTYSRASPLTI